jgi:hypothetical protein
MIQSQPRHKAIIGMSVFLFFSSLAISITAESKDFFRWTDENGSTHYTLHPPKGHESEKIRTSIGKSIRKANKTSATSPNSNTEAKEGKSDEESTPEETAPDTPEMIAQKKANCERANINLKALQEQARVRVKDGDNYRYLDQTEVKEQIKNSKQAVKDYC